MAGKPRDEKILIPVIPQHLEIADIYSTNLTPGGLLVKPAHYNVTIFLSIHVIQTIVRRAIKEHFIVSSRKLVIPNRTKKEKYDVSTKKENDAS